jgi:hypothetical protein
MTGPTASIGATIGGLLALACLPQETRDPAPNVALVQTCAPWDGPAIALFVTDQPAVATYPSPPYSSITIYRSVSEVLNRSFEVGVTTQNVGSGGVCPAMGECTPARTATVSFGGLEADSTVAVTYRIEASPDRVIAGKGRARLNPAHEMCG